MKNSMKKMTVATVVTMMVFSLTFVAKAEQFTIAGSVALAGFGAEMSTQSAEETESDVTDNVMTLSKDALGTEIQDVEGMTETEASPDYSDITETEIEEMSNDTTHYMEPGKTIDPVCGVFQGPWLKETYYNLDMSYCIEIMKVHFGIDKGYWVREDGVKMYGDYIMVAADTNVYPKGSIVETSLGRAMVVDHCEAAEWCPEFDIAVTW